MEKRTVDSMDFFTNVNPEGAIREIYEEEVYEKIRKIQKEDVIIDIGSHIGLFTFKASKKASLVVSIEPYPSSYKLLTRNIELNNLKNVIPLNLAVSNFDGKGELYLSSSCVGNSLVSSVHWVTDKTLEVEVRTLDTIIKELELKKIDFIKIDAEGAELEILKGAENTLKITSSLSIASYHYPKEAEKLREFLQDRFDVEIKNDGGSLYVYARRKRYLDLTEEEDRNFVKGSDYEDFYPITENLALVTTGDRLLTEIRIVTHWEVDENGKVIIKNSYPFIKGNHLRLGNIYKGKLFYSDDGYFEGEEKEQPFRFEGGLLYTFDTRIYMNGKILIDHWDNYISVGNPTVDGDLVYFEANKNGSQEGWDIWRFNLKTKEKELVKEHAANPNVLNGNLYYTKWNGRWEVYVERLIKNG